MLHYKNSLTSSPKYLNTTKSDFDMSTPSKFGPLSPSSKMEEKMSKITKVGGKVQLVKGDIDFLIAEMRNKSGASMSALRTVEEINRNAIGDFSRIPTSRNYHEQDYGPVSARFPDFRRVKSQESVPERFQMEYRQEHKRQPIPRQDQSKYAISKEMGLEQENALLRNALNEQMRENSNVMRRIQYLEHQNSQIRGTLRQMQKGNMPVSTAHTATSIPLHNIQSTKSMSHSRHNYPMGITSISETGIPMPISMLPKRNTHKKIPSDLLRELEDIKEQDEKLRQKALKVLRAGL